MTSQEWIVKLLDLLCLLYSKWTGKCEGLGADPGDRVKEVDSNYRSNGAPPAATHADVLVLLDDLEDLAADPANTLSQGDQDTLAAMISDLRADCGP